MSSVPKPVWLLAVGVASGMGGAAVAQGANGPALFAQHCGTCHLDPHAPAGSAKIGPSLVGIIGQSAASDPAYRRYSSALRNSGKVWSDAALSAYIEAPATEVPGTTMALVGVTNAAERAALVAYLKSAPKR